MFYLATFVEPVKENYVFHSYEEKFNSTKTEIDLVSDLWIH